MRHTSLTAAEKPRTGTSPRRRTARDVAVNSRVLMHVQEVAVEFKVRREAQQGSVECLETVPGALSFTMRSQGFSSS